MAAPFEQDVFVEDPDWEILKDLKKVDLISLANYFDIAVTKRDRKQIIH
jgi:hypothetical protein